MEAEKNAPEIICLSRACACTHEYMYVCIYTCVCVGRYGSNKYVGNALKSGTCVCQSLS